MTASARKPDAPGFTQEDWDEVSDNPALTEEELAQMRPAQELPSEIFEALPRNPGGRPRSAKPKQQITLRIDADVVAAYKATGTGWQTRMNQALAQGADRITSSHETKAEAAAAAKKVGHRKHGAGQFVEIEIRGLDGRIRGRETPRKRPTKRSA